jgi:hypothetical protein
MPYWNGEESTAINGHRHQLKLQATLINYDKAGAAQSPDAAWATAVRQSAKPSKPWRTAEICVEQDSRGWFEEDMPLTRQPVGEQFPLLPPLKPKNVKSGSGGAGSPSSRRTLPSAAAG